MNERNGIGLQLWTVRNQMDKDSAGTLKAIAKAGYEQVELMDVTKGADIVKMATDTGLEVRSGFFNWETIANPANKDAPKIEEIIEQATEYGLEHLVFGYVGKGHRETADQYKKMCENCNKAGELIQKAKMQLTYHNHSFEFAKVDGDKTGYDLMIEHFDPKLVQFEVDVFWVAIGGWDVYETMERLGERIGQVHLKDLKADVGVITDEGQVPHDAFKELGNGTIDMKRVLEIADKFKVKQFHVEQDQSPDPMVSITQSKSHLDTIWS